MVREKLAAVLLLMMVLISAWNIRAADRLCSKIEAELDRIEHHAQAENWDESRRAMERAIQIWLDAEEYTHIFIRHPEIDGCADVFYDCLSACLEEKPEELRANLKKLRYHLESVASMERVSVGNIF